MGYMTHYHISLLFGDSGPRVKWMSYGLTFSHRTLILCSRRLHQGRPLRRLLGPGRMASPARPANGPRGRLRVHSSAGPSRPSSSPLTLACPSPSPALAALVLLASPSRAASTATSSAPSSCTPLTTNAPDGLQQAPASLPAGTATSSPRPAETSGVPSPQPCLSPTQPRAWTLPSDYPQSQMPPRPTETRGPHQVFSSPHPPWTRPAETCPPTKFYLLPNPVLSSPLARAPK